MAVIALEGMHFYAYHGYYEEEKEIGNHFILDLYVETDISSAAETDKLYGDKQNSKESPNSVNYETLYFICQAQMKKPVKLLETIAERIVSKVKDQFPHVTSVKVRVKKKNPPLGAKVESAFVEVEYLRDGIDEIKKEKILKLLKNMLKE